MPYVEYRPDVSDLLGQYTQVATNVVPRGDGYGPFPSFSGYTAALDDSCRGFFKALRTDGSVSIFAATATKIYQLDNTDLTWDDVSKSLGTYSALSSTDQWQFAQFGNFVIAVQANVAPQVFDLTVSTEFADLAGSPPQARYISIVGRFVVLSGLLSFPYRIQWSGLNATTTWTSGVNSSDFQDFPDGGTVRGVAGGEFGMVFQDGAIRRMTYAPGSPVIFQIERISDDQGLYAAYSLVRSGDRIFYRSARGFEMFTSGSVQSVQIGKERVDRTFQDDVDAGNLQLFLGAADPRSSRVFWAYKSISGVSGKFDKLLCYDYALNRFSGPINVSGEFLSSLSQPGVTLEGLDAISTSIDLLPASLDSYTTSVTPEIAAFDATHVLGFFRGDNLEAVVETQEQGTDGRRIFVRGVRPITDAATVYCSISKRENASAARTWTTETLVNGQGFCPARASTRYARARTRIPAATDWTYASGVEPEVSQEGGR